MPMMPLGARATLWLLMAALGAVRSAGTPAVTSETITAVLNGRTLSHGDKQLATVTNSMFLGEQHDRDCSGTSRSSQCYLLAGTDVLDVRDDADNVCASSDSHKVFKHHSPFVLSTLAHRGKDAWAGCRPRSTRSAPWSCTGRASGHAGRV